MCEACRSRDVTGSVTIESDYVASGTSRSMQQLVDDQSPKHWQSTPSRCALFGKVIENVHATEPIIGEIVWSIQIPHARK